jgi:hypothetical protein
MASDAEWKRKFTKSEQQFKETTEDLETKVGKLA